MASGTRSGRVQKDEDTGSSRSAGGKSKDMKGSTASGSTASDSPKLRRSIRETSGKKMMALSLSPWKSERLENQAPSVSTDTKKSERVEKKTSLGSLRRSGRIEKNGGSSSSGSKKSGNNSSSLISKKKKKDKKSGKLKVVGTIEQNNDRKVDTESCGLSKKRKRLDAHSYRSFLRQQVKVTKSSEASKKHQKEDSTSQEDAINLGASDRKAMQEGGDDCSWRMGQEPELSDQCGNEPAEGSSSDSREFAGLALRNGASNKERKLCSIEANRSIDESKSSLSKSSDNSSPSSPVIVTEKVNDGDAIDRVVDDQDGRIVAYRLSKKKPRTPKLVKTSSGERSPSVDVDPESGVNVGASKIGNMTANLASAYSVTLLDKEFSVRDTSIAHATSSPLETKNRNMRQSTLCCKLQRVHSDLQAPETHLHNSETRHDLSMSYPEDRGRLRAGNITGSAEDNHSSAESLLPMQRNTGSNACVICKKPGLLLCCDGKDCKRSYHLSCLDPILKDIPLGVWLCLFCTKKKMESGVYSVSQGIESIWDVREEMQNGKHYLVKYKGLAHVHNRWIPESQMLLEAPLLLAKFNRRYQKEKAIRWKQEWTEPHRLPQKRLLMPRKLADEYFSGQCNNTSYCYHEWLVKWKGLGYEHATWEFENSLFLCSSEAISLIKDYESRHEEAKKASDPSRADKALQVKKDAFHNISSLPDGFHPGIGLDNDHLNSINRLREFWHRSKNAIFLDDQERIIKSILFILALQSHTCLPFLIISTISSLSLWESEFARLAPSINIVVYSGNKDVRKMIRTLEFYEEGGCIMFQVLLSHPDAILEDFETLDCIGWEAMLVDECQNSRISKHLEKLQRLSTDFRLLLLSGQLKDNLAEYLNLLSFLDSGGREDCVSSLKYDSKDSVGALAILKERLAHYLAYECKQDSSKFLEYWVPVRLSNVQLEQYCATLVSNAIALRSCSKIDHVGALRDILISSRKCCDHPYIVDPLLQSTLTKDLPAGEYLDIGVNASGKLLLLDKVLQEMKNQGLRVLILFQSIGGAGRNSIGDILDDFLRQRFGADTYERVDSGLAMSKKLAALNMFNDKARGRFVFLIENRACLPSIKLSSVDAVIIFDSDWNPLNDLRALQKISIESGSEQIKVFRLYSSCTVEEKVLIFAKQDMILESNIQNISPSVSHSLLSWGASYLFSKLDEFHQHDKQSNCSETSTGQLFLNDVVSELLTQLSGKVEASDTSNCSILIKTQHSGVSYSRNIILVGEKEGVSSFNKDPPSFWSNLLEGRHPKWRYISRSSQRIRRKVQIMDQLAKVPEAENDERKRKRRKASDDTVDLLSLQTGFQEKRKEADFGKDSMMPDDPHTSRSSSQSSPISPRKTPVISSSMPKEPEASPNPANVGSEGMPHSPSIGNHVIHNLHTLPISDDIPEEHKPDIVEFEGREKLRNAQRSLHLLLKPELSKLCETLKLPEDVKGMAEKLLEYIMNNHHVSREPETILQAFVISLCWRAASLLKHGVDRKESLALAKKYLNFKCDEGQAYSVYLKLRMLKKKFSCRTGPLRDDSDMNSPESRSLVSAKDGPTESMFGQTSKSATSSHSVSEGHKTRETTDGLWCIHDQIKQEQTTILESPANRQEHIGSLKDELLKKRLDLIEKICSSREEELLLKQQVELSDFNVQREVEKMKLKEAYDMELGVTRSIILDSTARNYKIKRLNHEFSRKMAAFDQHMKFQRRKLAVMQADAKNKERQIKDRWLEEAKAGRIAEFFDKLPLSDSGFTLEGFMVSEKDGVCEGLESTMLTPVTSSDLVCIDSVSTGQVKSIKSAAEFSEISAVHTYGLVDNIAVVTEAPDSQFTSTNELECFEPFGTNVGIPATVSSGVACEITADTESPATVLPEVAGEMPNREMENMIVEAEAPVSQCNNINEAEPIEPGDMPLENRATVLPEMEFELPMVNVSSTSHSDMIDAVGSGTMITSSETAKIVNSKQDVGKDASDDPCLISSLQSQTEFSSLDNVSTSRVCVNSVSSNQEPSVSEHEGLNVPVGVKTGQGFGSLHQVVVPVLNSVACAPSQVEQINHNISVADSLQLLLPPSIVIPLIEHSQGNTHTPIASAEESSSGTHFYTQQSEAPIQQRIVAASVQVEQAENLISESDVNPQSPLSATTLGGTCSEDLSNTCYQTHCSTQQTEALTQQPVVATAMQAEKSDQLVSHDMHLLPPSTASPRTCSGDLSNLQCSFPQTEVMMQQSIVAAAVQVDLSNQEVSQPFVHPVPPVATVLPERTCSEDLSSTVIQPQSGSRFLQNLATANWMPPQGLHPDPLQNELLKIRRQQDLCIKMQEDKKLRLKLECDLELEKVRRKYDALLQDAETEFLQDKKILDTIYNKVLMNRLLAEQFRAKFIENKGGASAPWQGSRTSYLQQFVQPPQPQRGAQRPASVSPSTLFPTPATLPPVPLSAPATTPSSLASVRLRVPASAVSSVTSAQVFRHASSAAISSNPIRPHLSPTFLPHANLQVGSEPHASDLSPPFLPRVNLQVGSEPRAPAPHLHRFRPHASISAQTLPLQIGIVTGQQQPLANLGSTSSIPLSVVAIPPTAPSMAPGSPGILPVCGGNSLPPIDLPPDAEDSQVGADLSNLTPLSEDVPVFDGYLSSNLAIADIEVPLSSTDAMIPVATSNVVCISDDE